MSGQQTEKTTLGQTLAAELKHEATATRKMLERVPADKFEWSPHDKSMSLGRLATHVAEVPQWVSPTVTQEELDFGKNDYKPANLNTPNELIEAFDKGLNEALDALQNVSDEDLMQTWTLRNGEEIILAMPRAAVLRSMVLNHLIHHRGQLSVYLRLQDVSLPGVYGPTADEQTM